MYVKKIWTFDDQLSMIDRYMLLPPNTNNNHRELESEEYLNNSYYLLTSEIYSIHTACLHPSTIYSLLGTKSLHADECIIGTNTPLARQLLNVQLTPLNAGNQLPFSNFNPLWWWLQASKAAPIAGSTWNFMAFCLTSEGMVVHPFFLKKITNAYTNFLGTKVFSPCFQIDISLLSWWEKCMRIYPKICYWHMPFIIPSKSEIKKTWLLI